MQGLSRAKPAHGPVSFVASLLHPSSWYMPPAAVRTAEQGLNGPGRTQSNPHHPPAMSAASR